MRSRNGDRNAHGGDRAILDRGYGLGRRGDRYTTDRWYNVPGAAPGGGGGGGFSPSDVTGLIGWWEADTITGVADGARANSVTDQSSAHNNATSATGPIYYANQLRRVAEALKHKALDKMTREDRDIISTLPDNVIDIQDLPENFLVNKPALYYDGNGSLNLAATIPLSGAWTSIALVKAQNFYQMNTLRSTGTGTTCALMSPSGPVYVRVCYDGVGVADSAQSLTAGTWYIVLTDSTAVCSVNGTPLTLAYSGPFGDGSPLSKLGADVGGGNVGLLALVLHYNNLVSAGNRTSLIQWTGTKYGITVA